MDEIKRKMKNGWKKKNWGALRTSKRRDEKIKKMYLI